MVERSRRGKGKRKFLGSHQRSWLWGRNLVQETLAAGRWQIVELYLACELPADQLETARAAALKWDIVPQIVEPQMLRQLAHTSEHQGYLARMGPFPYREASELLAAARPRSLYLVLDGIQDPYNFGAILRSADAFGVDGVFIGVVRQVGVTSMVARSSAGGVNRVSISQVTELSALIDSLRERQIQVIGASEKSELPLQACDFRGSTTIVIGNEGHGISPELLSRCDRLAQIPMEGQLGSLNAAVAASVFCYEAQRQRRQ